MHKVQQAVRSYLAHKNGNDRSVIEERIKSSPQRTRSRLRILAAHKCCGVHAHDATLAECSIYRLSSTQQHSQYRETLDFARNVLDYQMKTLKYQQPCNCATCKTLRYCGLQTTESRHPKMEDEEEEEEATWKIVPPHSICPKVLRIETFLGKKKAKKTLRTSNLACCISYLRRLPCVRQALPLSRTRFQVPRESTELRESGFAGSNHRSLLCSVIWSTAARKATQRATPSTKLGCDSSTSNRAGIPLPEL